MSTSHNILYCSIAGITFKLSSELPLNKELYNSNILQFIISEPTNDVIQVHFHFSLPEDKKNDDDCLVYDEPPWQVYSNPKGWNYIGVTGDSNSPFFQIVRLDNLYQNIDVYHPDRALLTRRKLESIVVNPSDQIVLIPILAQRQACIIHSAGLIFNGAGLLFVGHSEAGKSTMVKLLRDESEILCDDRIILRRWPDGIKIHGTWSHGEIPDVSPSSAPLRALLFLEKAPHNALVPMTPGEVARALPQYVIKTLTGREWWLKTLDLVEHVAREVPAYRVQFDKSGAIKELLRQL